MSASGLAVGCGDDEPLGRFANGEQLACGESDGGSPGSDSGGSTGPGTTTDAAPATGGNSSACRFSKADSPLSIAFCDSFDAPTTNGAAFSRSGDMNGAIWGVSRNNTGVNLGQGLINDVCPATLVGCGADQTVFPPNDVQICNGRVLEAVNDCGGQSTLAMYPKQPFDISGGRTGTVVFDVSADSEGPHAAWPEFWWTDQPVPAPGDHRAAQAPFARNSFGIVLSRACPAGYSGIDHMSVTRNYAASSLAFDNPLPWTPETQGCFKSGSATGELNHFEIRISQNHIEVWVTEPGSTDLKLIGVADNANLPLVKGLLWMVDAHYNANKSDHQGDHTFAWDNFGFDGPKTYRDLAFDVPDSRVPSGSNLRLGYYMGSSPISLPVRGVYRLQTPTSALVTFDWFPMNPAVPSVSLNGGAWHDTPWPFDAQTYAWRTIAVTVPVSEIHDGDNTIEIKDAEDSVISNIDVILVAGSPVP